MVRARLRAARWHHVVGRAEGTKPAYIRSNR